jgi:hypothetical protein
MFLKEIKACYKQDTEKSTHTDFYPDSRVGLLITTDDLFIC